MNKSEHNTKQGETDEIDESIKYQFASFVRNQWFSFFKWTAGISIFLITVTLTTLNLSNNIGLDHILIAGFLISVFTATLIWIWFLLKKAIFKIYAPMDLSIGGVKITPEKEKDFEEAVKSMEKHENCIFILFILGIVLFIMFMFVITVKGGVF